MNNNIIRKATKEDIDTIYSCVKGLAEHVDQLELFTASKQELCNQLFLTDRSEKVIIAETEMNETLGFALYFDILSTFKANSYLFIEDLFIFPQYRSLGVGKKIFEYLVSEAKSCGAHKIEWNVNCHNVRAIRFYEHLGARHLEHKYVYSFEINSNSNEIQISPF